MAIIGFRGKGWMATMQSFNKFSKVALAQSNIRASRDLKVDNSGRAVVPMDLLFDFRYWYQTFVIHGW
ncbi:hypothetical protein BBC0244_018330 [Bartonella apihabitans]|uniref:hypothetical protein n=1 Tax=Bartonella apihabitans TaxID=2750929 RepID=UPI0009C31D8E|nr:hypothetical protein [Bartonella apihabitans]AQT45509.1 hypothetical protein BBC0244_018330 [Bartonella apihabitans]